MPRGPDTVRVTKVKGHVIHADVEQGRVRMEDRLGSVMIRLTLLLTCAGVIRPKMLWRCPCSMLGISGILSCFDCTGSSPACLPERPWVQVHGGCVNGADIAAWPKSVSLLCKLAF